MAKCLDCKLCLDVIWINNKVYLQCWLCKTYYRRELGSKILTKVSNEFIQQQIEDENTESNQTRESTKET